MSRGKNPKSSFRQGKFVKVTRFNNDEASLFQSLLFGMLETLIRFKNFDISTKKLKENLMTDLQSAKMAAAKNNKNLESLSEFEVLFDLLIKTNLPSRGFSLLETNCTQESVCKSLEVTMKLLIKAITPKDISFHLELFTSQCIEHTNKILEIIALNYEICIKLIDSEKNEKVFIPETIKYYPILYIYNGNDNFMILYTQEALDIEAGSTDYNILKHPNLLVKSDIKATGPKINCKQPQSSFLPNKISNPGLINNEFISENPGDYKKLPGRPMEAPVIGVNPSGPEKLGGLLNAGGQGRICGGFVGTGGEAYNKRGVSNEPYRQSEFQMLGGTENYPRAPYDKRLNEASGTPFYMQGMGNRNMGGPYGGFNYNKGGMGMHPQGYASNIARPEPVNKLPQSGMGMLPPGVAMPSRLGMQPNYIESPPRIMGVPFGHKEPGMYAKIAGPDLIKGNSNLNGNPGMNLQYSPFNPRYTESSDFNNLYRNPIETPSHDSSKAKMSSSIINTSEPLILKEDIINIYSYTHTDFYVEVKKGIWNNKNIIIKRYKSIDSTLWNPKNFDKEIKILQKCSDFAQSGYPFLQCYGVHLTPGCITILLELIETDLGKKIKTMKDNNEQFSEYEVEKIVLRLVQGFSMLEQVGIKHQDIKPQNILVFGSGENIDVKIIDFSVSDFKLLGMANTHTGQAMTTAMYRAPELVGKGEVKFNAFKADTYSLGLVFYQLSDVNVNIYGKNDERYQEELFIEIGRVKCIWLRNLLFKMLDKVERRLTFVGLSHFLPKKPNEIIEFTLKD